MAIDTVSGITAATTEAHPGWAVVDLAGNMSVSEMLNSGAAGTPVVLERIPAVDMTTNQTITAGSYYQPYCEQWFLTNPNALAPLSTQGNLLCFQSIVTFNAPESSGLNQNGLIPFQPQIVNDFAAWTGTAKVWHAGFSLSRIPFPSAVEGAAVGKPLSYTAASSSKDEVKSAAAPERHLSRAHLSRLRDGEALSGRLPCGLAPFADLCSLLIVR
jgi:hypothetical protein